MADYIVTSGELTSVANAIREKNGTSSSLSWPNGFVSGIGSGGGGSTWNTVFEGSVTTAQTEGMPYPSNTHDITLTLSGADRIKVTFNGQEYELPKALVGGNFGYGALSEGTPDLNTYPLFIAQNSNSIIVFTQTAGTYSLKIEEPQSGGESDFSTAVVTIVNNTDAETAGGLLMTIIDEIDDETMMITVNSLPSGIFTAPLYKGALNAAYLGRRVATVSGNAEYDDGDITITGDCTITIS